MRKYKDESVKCRWNQSSCLAEKEGKLNGGWNLPAVIYGHGPQGLQSCCEREQDKYQPQSVVREISYQPGKQKLPLVVEGNNLMERIKALQNHQNNAAQISKAKTFRKQERTGLTGNYYWCSQLIPQVNQQCGSGGSQLFTYYVASTSAYRFFDSTKSLFLQKFHIFM